ncbi:hypothetical protein CL633_01375 [bacterium]|nr:hypothetical protein [bacterium]|tara:strand:+ start:17700 stop:19925 length:2226 start_codon:yes stop_codon:yes gene_type:complete
MVGLINILLFAVAIANLILGSLLIFKKRSKANIFFGIAVYGVALWNLSMALFRITENPNSLMFWCKMLYIAATITASGFLYFSYVFPLNKFTIKSVKKFVLLLPPIIMITIISLPNTFIKNINVFSNYYRTVEFDKTYILYALLIAGYFALAFYKLIKAYKNNTGLAKYQLLYVLLGSVISAVIGIIADLFMPWLGYFQAYWVGPVFTLIMVLFITYAIIRYRLMDIRIAIRKSSFYILIAGFVYGFFYATIWLMNRLFSSVHAPSALILGCFLAIAFVMIFILIERLGRKAISKHLFGALYSQHKTLSKLTQELTTIIDLDQLTALIINTVLKTLKLDKAAILFRKEQNKHYQIQKIVGFQEENIKLLMQDNFLINYLEKFKKPIICEELKELTAIDKKEQLINLKSAMQKTEAVVFLPLIIKNDLEGIIILGKKSSQAVYTKEDLRLLEALANQTSIAIENARLFTQVQDLSNKLKDLNQNLEQKVADQTKDIRKKAEDIKALLSMKSELLNTISHQLRTPTSIFRGMLSMIGEKGKGAMEEKEREEFIQKSLTAADRLVVIINTITQANELQGGISSLEFKPISISQVIQESMSFFQRSAKEKNIDLKFIKSKEKFPKIMADPNYLKPALEKLIDNAVWYTHKNGKIEISTEHDKQNNTLNIIIKDTGIGLSEEDKKILFTQFGRGRGSKHMNVNTSGLGLYIAKKIAEAHNGAVTAESEGKDKGSTFTLTIPIMQEA